MKPNEHRQADRKAGRQEGRQVGRQEGRQAGRPVGLPDVDGVGVRDVVQQGLLVQQIKVVLKSQGNRPAGAVDHREQVIHKLLEGSLEGRRGRGIGRQCRCLCVSFS